MEYKTEATIIDVARSLRDALVKCLGGPMSDGEVKPLPSGPFIKTRDQAVRFIENQFFIGYAYKGDKDGRWNYGIQDAIELLGFIYGPPKTPEDCIKKPRM